jgi:hypothetical protein
MNRSTVGLLLILGWQLGLLTAILMPAVSVERRTVIVSVESGVRPEDVAAAIQRGWIVIHTATVGPSFLVTFERPHYVAVLEALQSLWSGPAASTSRAPSPVVPTAVPAKPTTLPIPPVFPPTPTGSPRAP